MVEVRGPDAELNFLELEMRAGEYYGAAVVVRGERANSSDSGRCMQKHSACAILVVHSSLRLPFFWFVSCI